MRIMSVICSGIGTRDTFVSNKLTKFGRCDSQTIALINLKKTSLIDSLTHRGNYKEMLSHLKMMMTIMMVVNMMVMIMMVVVIMVEKLYC